MLHKYGVNQRLLNLCGADDVLLIFQSLLQGNLLNAHLNEIDRQAHEMVEQIVQQLIHAEHFDESVKLSNPILWVQKMNSFKDIAEESVMHDLIYC